MKNSLLSISLAVLTLLPGLSVPANCAPTAESRSNSCTLTIKGDKTEFNEAMLFYYAAGHAKAEIEGQDCVVEADAIRYNHLEGMMDLRGHVKIVRKAQMTKGGAFRFRVNSPEYMITKERCHVSQVSLVKNER